MYLLIGLQTCSVPSSCWSDQIRSVAQSCPTLCSPLDCRTRGPSPFIINSLSPLKLTSIESVMPSSHLILCRPLLLLPPILPSIRVWVYVLSRVQLFPIPWTVAHQAPLYIKILQARILEWVAMPSSRDLPNPGTEPSSPTLQAVSLLTESPRKPQNTGMGRLSLLQGIFPTQELNWDLLHCRCVLYQLSYQGSPVFFIATVILKLWFSKTAAKLARWRWV